MNALLRRTMHRLRLRAALNGRLASKPPHYLCSYPKSGRTWLRFILANYFNIRHGLGLDLDFDNLFHILPNLSTSLRRGVDAYRFASDPRIPLVLSSHRPFSDSEFRGGDVVFMVRNVCDVLVSNYFHTTRQRREKRRFDGDLSAFVRDPGQGVAHYARYMNSWAPALRDKSSLVVSYESLSAEPERTAARVLAFLGAGEVAEDALARATGASTFDRMRETEVTKGIGGQNYDRSDPDALRVRKGKIGGYVEYLADTEVRFVAERCRELLDAKTVAMLEELAVLP